MVDYTATFTDQYELTMAQVYLLKNKKEDKAVFDYFFRKLPFNGGYAVFAGLEVLLEVLEDLHFDKKDIHYLQVQGFHPEFIKYIETFRFRGDIYSCMEGDLVFPTHPVLIVEANIIEAQIIETILLNTLNFQTLIATKASRMRQAAEEHTLINFGLRRAHGTGGYYASRAAIIGGFNATSNVRAGRDFHVPVSGTMAHSFVQSYDDELTAFRDFAGELPEDCVLLVDTYDTLNSGLPNAVTVGKEMRERGNRLAGIRLDSGDLAYLARRCRKILDEAGLTDVKIAVSNQLDEYIIKSLLDQHAPIDVFGVGTSLVTGQPDAALDGVYKLAFANGKPCIKLSENIAKITLPDKKQVYRILDSNGDFIGADVIALCKEQDVQFMHHPWEPLKTLPFPGYHKEPLLKKVMENGKRIFKPRPLTEIAEYRRERINHLPEEYKRFRNPHIYKIGISNELKIKRDLLIKEHRKG